MTAFRSILLLASGALMLASLTAEPQTLSRAVLTKGIVGHPASEVGVGQDAAPVTCLLVDGGHLSGTVLHDGAPAPDGTFVDLIFAGGPVLRQATVSGRYSFRLLAQACSNGLRWRPFTVWAGGAVQRISEPPNWEVHADLDAPAPVTLAEAASFPNGPPALCQLILGTVSGNVLVDGAAAPDGTVVSASMAPGLPSSSQVTLTANGRYIVTSVGTRCSRSATGSPSSDQFPELDITALGASLTVTPDGPSVSQDIMVTTPPAPSTSQAPAR